MIDTRCQAQVHNGSYTVTFHRCLRKGKVERDGVWYCGTHDPVKVAERLAERNAKWDAANKKRQEEFRKEREAKRRIPKLEELIREYRLSHGILCGCVACGTADKLLPSE